MSDAHIPSHVRRGDQEGVKADLSVTVKRMEIPEYSV